MTKPCNSKDYSRRRFIKSAGVAATGLIVFSSAKPKYAYSDVSPKALTVFNPTTYRFKNELVCLKADLTGTEKSFLVRNGSREVPCQVEEIDGKKKLWICEDFEPASSAHFEIIAGKPGVFDPKVVLQQDGDFFTVKNSAVCMRIPAHAQNGIPGPIAGIRLNNGAFAGTSEWKTQKKLKKYSVEVIGDGTLLAKLRLHYEFEGIRSRRCFSQIDIMLAPDWEHASIFEKHEMDPEDYWELTLSAGWSPRKGISRQFNNGAGGDLAYSVPPMDRPLVPVDNVSFAPGLYINLIPRWNQHFKDGWAFAATDDSNYLSAVVVRASQWEWPHDNNLQCLVKPEGDYAAIRCSTWHGQRLWWISPSLAPVDTNYIALHAWESLDKINNEYILENQGKPIRWWSINPYNSEQTNPTGKVRRIGKEALKKVDEPADDSTLIRFQTLIHKDCWGSYWNYFSPENPNFFTDFNLVPIALAATLRTHPNFYYFRKLAESKFREDLYHSITLPGGAGQECPGYGHYGLTLWKEIIEVGKKYLNFEMAFIDERMQAAEKFYKRISYPDGAVRRGSPVGDSHPDREGKTGMPVVNADASEVKNWKTEELPGFGVVFTNRPDTDRETYLSFKSGPNRCHYHGDQLAFHYCANGRPLVVDHHCSYHPRAGQEHMHNRMAFFTSEMPYANMDGYERLIAFKTSEIADVAIGQVESSRLRAVAPLPPEVWDARYPQLKFSTPLVYRRTVILVKNEAQDYFVFRDQYWADRSIGAACCFHTYGDEAIQKGQAICLGKLTVYCTHQFFTMKKFAWSHENGGLESTNGIRLETEGNSGDLVTVVYPGREIPDMKAVRNGVMVGDDIITFCESTQKVSAQTDAVKIVRKGKICLTIRGKEIDLDRWQGEIGLFIPDAGYPFGDIPEWLIRQRAHKPEWAGKL